MHMQKNAEYAENLMVNPDTKITPNPRVNT
jgi:hypothetical protein